MQTQKIMKHTKGKWIVGNITTDYPRSRLVLTEIKDGSNPDFTLEICKVLPKVDGSRGANAKLIAAAPELLKCLMECVQELIDEAPEANPFLIQIAKNTIKKATE